MDVLLCMHLSWLSQPYCRPLAEARGATRGRGCNADANAPVPQLSPLSVTFVSGRMEGLVMSGGYVHQVLSWGYFGLRERQGDMEDKVHQALEFLSWYIK